MKFILTLSFVLVILPGTIVAQKSVVDEVVIISGRQLQAMDSLPDEVQSFVKSVILTIPLSFQSSYQFKDKTLTVSIRSDLKRRRFKFFRLPGHLATIKVEQNYKNNSTTYHCDLSRLLSRQFAAPYLNGALENWTRHRRDEGLKAGTTSQVQKVESRNNSRYVTVQLYFKKATAK